MRSGDRWLVSAHGGGERGKFLNYIVHPPIAVTSRLPIANQTVGPGPLDMLHGAARLGEHDVTQAGVVGRGGAIGDGEVAARVIAV